MNALSRDIGSQPRPSGPQDIEIPPIRASFGPAWRRPLAEDQEAATCKEYKIERIFVYDVDGVPARGKMSLEWLRKRARKCNA